MKFECITCSKKFLESDYKKPHILSDLDTHRYRSDLATHYINETEFGKSKWMNHLCLPINKPQRHPSGKCFIAGKGPKPFHFVCPKSTCIICLVKTGEAPQFSTRDQFNYHRRSCPYREINYREFIRLKHYDTDTTLSNAMEVLSDEESHDEGLTTDITEEIDSSSESEEEIDYNEHTFYVGHSAERWAEIKKGAEERAKKYKNVTISDKELQNLINNVC